MTSNVDEALATWIMLDPDRMLLTWWAQDDMQFVSITKNMTLVTPPGFSKPMPVPFVIWEPFQFEILVNLRWSVKEAPWLPQNPDL